MLESQIYRGGIQTPTIQQVEEIEEPQIEIEEASGDYARVVATPLPPGFGITLGNALRRVLLSSLQGAAVTSVRIDGVLHEFSTIPSVKEDTIEFLLNVKEMRLRALSERPGTLILDLTGREGAVTAADINTPEHIEIVNPELYLATIDSPEARLYIEFNVELGRGYEPAGQVDGTTIGVIPIDAIFSPVRKVNYRVEHTRVGQATNYDKLTLDVWTDGTISGAEAVSKSADVAIEQLRLFSHMGQPAQPVVERGLGAGLSLAPDKYNMPIEDLNLSMRAYNCLRRSGLITLGQVLEKSEEELLALRNFGRKSYDELREKLDEMRIISADHGEAPLLEAQPLDDDATPIAADRIEVAPGTDEDQLSAPPSLEPAPFGSPKKLPRVRSKAKAAAATIDDEDDEEPEWKRALRALEQDKGDES